ncbi:MAG TPA: response regulator transcription factor [Ferruginibacter sp.]|jgi:DNA-binding NarL/FixJ family response regulator|nr:response regulator transcription factor [Ferruginibacter sp.]
MNSNNTFNIILADDHILLRDALANLINSFDEFRVVAVAGNGEEVKQAIGTGPRPAIILMDLSMPVLDGFETARWLQMHHPDIRVLILTMYDSEITLIRLLRLGVNGFLKKDIHPAELRSALIAVAAGEYYYSNRTTGKIASLLRNSDEKRSPLENATLNDVEIQFLRLACSDLTYKEIAHEMKMTPRNIDSYRDALFDKLDVKSRVGLAIYAIKSGIVNF